MKTNWMIGFLIACFWVGCGAQTHLPEENGPISILDGGQTYDKNTPQETATFPDDGGGSIDLDEHSSLPDSKPEPSTEPTLQDEATQFESPLPDGGSADRSEPSAIPEEKFVPEPTKDNPPRDSGLACIGADGKDLCDDGNDCNGREVCDRATGKCKAASTPQCPVAPGECNQTGGASKPTTGTTVAATPIQGFRLQDLQQWNSAQTIVDTIAQHPSVKKVTLAQLLQNLNRTATRVTSVPGLSCLNLGFQWDSGDGGVSYWYPQGLGGSATATANERYDNKSVLVASWYHKPENDSSTNVNKGVRVSFVDITTPSAIRYRHALLVEPTMSAGKAQFKPVTVHAGGVAWYRNYLYIPDTTKGFRVFDLTRILQVKTTDKDLVGYNAATDEYHGFGYLYVIPQVNMYSRCSGSCCVRFSFVSANVSLNPPSLLSGEYTSADERGRLHRWLLDPSTGRLQVQNRTAVAVEAMFPGVRKVQGATLIGKTYWISSSQPKSTSPTSPGTLYKGTLNQKVGAYRYPYPPEDMHHIPSSGLLWSQTENPNQRYVYSIKPGSLGSTCP